MKTNQVTAAVRVPKWSGVVVRAGFARTVRWGRWSRRHFAVGLVGVMLCALFTVPARGATITDNFDQGIALDRWYVAGNSTPSAPWNVAAPDSTGRLIISKAADSDTATSTAWLSGELYSWFYLVGNLSVSLDFNLQYFPLSNTQEGYNEAGIRLRAIASGAGVSSLCLTDDVRQYAEGWADSPGVLRRVTDTSTTGKLGMSRVGQTVSAWIDRGSGPVSLGSVDYPEFTGPVQVDIFAVQFGKPGYPRCSTALDVRFDNFTATADSIVPEPSTFALLGVGLLALLAFAWRRRKQQLIA